MLTLNPLMRSDCAIVNKNGTDGKLYYNDGTDPQQLMRCDLCICQSRAPFPKETNNNKRKKKIPMSHRGQYEMIQNKTQMSNM